MHSSTTIRPLRRITVASTFTCDPIAESLHFWASALGHEADVRFSPYDQVFQELVNSGSVLNDPKSDGRFVFLKLDDWIRNQDAALEETALVSLMESNLQMLCDYAVSAASAAKSPLLIFITPNKPDSRISAAHQQQFEKAIGEKLEGVSNIHLVFPGEVQRQYHVNAYYDAQRDQLGHIPYTREFFTALGSSTYRKLTAAGRKPYKVIVLDCDNTLWGGVCGEVGPEGIGLSSPFTALQRFMLDQVKTGKILCLCSKNVEEDVDRVFAERPDMLITKEDIVGSKVNWEPKSQNIRELAEELNLGLDSFIFVDDNPVECAEVRAACPEVLVLNLPENTAEFETFLNHVWPFDALTTTAEDQQRTRLYKDNMKRAGFKNNASSLKEFIEGLNLQITVSDPQPEEISRVSQLTYRTNQFNFTTIRRSEEEIKALLASGSYSCKTCRVKDRFGDYGLVGVMLYETRADRVVLDSFMLSCRVLGRGVEHQMLKSVGEAAVAAGKEEVQINFSRTEKNKPALKFLNSVFDNFEQKLTDTESAGGYLTDAAWLSRLSYAADEKAQDESKRNDAKASAEQKVGKADKSASAAPDRALNPEKIARSLNSVSGILGQIRANGRQAGPKATGAESTEKVITGIWEEVLQASGIGPNQHFFDVGGTSLKAVEVLSQLNERFGKNLTIVSLFEHSTIRELTGLIEGSQALKPKADTSSRNGTHKNQNTDIAIVGMAGRFPKAKNVDEYWDNLVNGRECFTELTDEQMLKSGVDPELLKDPDYVRVSPVLEDYDKFDAHFFGYTPREVSMMDPQQRLFLECCWEAFEDAGYDPHAYEAPVGVFGGCAINSYMVFSGVHRRFYSEFLPSVVGNDNSFLANRVSYQLNLNGPAVSVQTACSTGLVSVHLGMQSLLNGECRMALAGGVAVWVPHEAGHLYKEGSVFTKDG
ncbi:MAG: HAD-IIIC family phosphatase, partial [Balneolia bacterium]|nr:HAD-IIIC family phosphatase [Balneolia bacterium]